MRSHIDIRVFIQYLPYLLAEIPRQVEVRRVIRNIHNGTTCRMALIDTCNMSIAESTFSHLQAYGPLLKKMSACRSRYYIREIVVSKNDMLTKKLFSKGMDPHPHVGERRWQA